MDKIFKTQVRTLIRCNMSVTPLSHKTLRDCNSLRTIPIPGVVAWFETKGVVKHRPFANLLHLTKCDNGATITLAFDEHYPAHPAVITRTTSKTDIKELPIMDQGENLRSYVSKLVTSL